MSAYVFFGSLGVLVMTKTGGVLFDTINPTAPFLFSGALALFYALGIAVFALCRPSISLN